MKKSFKLLFVLAIFLFSFQSYSQVIMGIKGGVNFADMEWEDYGEYNFETTNTIGYHIGLQMEFLLSDVFSVETGIYWSKKGAEINNHVYDQQYGSISWDSKMDINYIDWPVTIKVGLPIGDVVKVYVAAGGFLNWGISGKFDTGDGTEDVWGDEFEYLEKYDYGATFGAGIEVSKIQISASYDLGLADIGANKISINQSVLKASVAYLFW